ncbi:CMRF35-like molecule 6 [Pempheris klunzingeri]|uniref:CMRF35-like molecule 6 n=1 Tax=Pempheris klunzingeri TaxID=3127111 RepID=UPI0039817EB8
MGATWMSWRTTTAIIITTLQIQAVISVKTRAVTGVEGQTLDIICNYPDHLQKNAKYFFRVDDSVSSDHLIRTDKHNQWVRDGRFSLYDNATGASFIVRVDKLTKQDSGMYLCGVDISFQVDHLSVIQLNISQGNAPESFVEYTTASPIFPMNKFNLPLYLTVVMCVAAILCVCLFTLCLLLVVKQRRSGPRQNRETSSDYETMTPGVGTDPEFYCSCSDCIDLSAQPLPRPDLCSHFTSKQRVSTVTLGLGEYVDVDVPGHVCHYQQLDVSLSEEHVYHSLRRNGGLKDGPPGDKEQTVNC